MMVDRYSTLLLLKISSENVRGASNKRKIIKLASLRTTEIFLYKFIYTLE